MFSFKRYIYATLGISFFLLLSSILLSYQNIQNSNSILQHLSRDQIKLYYYTNKLNYDIKKNQADILQTTLLHETFTASQEQKAFQTIEISLAKLQEFLKENPTLPKEFSQRLEIVSKRIVAFKIVQNSLIEAIALNDIEDIEDALIGFNSISKEFDKDTEQLIDLANIELYENVLELTENNNESSNSLIFSFLIAMILIGFSSYRFITLQNNLHQQLKRAENAENDLQKAQIKLLKYNDDLEAEIDKKTKELHNKIYTHVLSALPNRNRLIEDISLYKFAYMAILNIDKFQSFNDVYGEDVGNVILTMSAEFLKEEVQNEPLSLYHIGGDEFVIVSSHHDAYSNQSFTQEIERILKDFRSKTFIYEDKPFQFMMSAGLSFDGKLKILAHADMALKDAKKRNIQLSIFNENDAIEKTHQENIECRKKLIYALENDKVLSYFQPIVPIQDISKKTKYESLVRISDEEGNIIPPFNFLDLAKTSRIYYKITRTVIKNTLETIEKYSVPCSLNLSLNDIENEKTMQHLFHILDSFEHTELLTVELLETEDFKNYKMVYDFCIKIRSYGVKVALDDFGSGYSNFSHILQLPVDYIKIDSSLISNIDRDISSQIMVETIVDLAHKLNVITIAEFVSSEEILTIIKDIGVDYAQGFYFGKPLEISEYIRG